MTALGLLIIGLMEYNAGQYYQEITLLILFAGFFGVAICAAILILFNDCSPKWKK
jgi:hypothetical protein